MKLIPCVAIALAMVVLPAGADDPPPIRGSDGEAVPATSAEDAEDAEMEAAIERLNQEPEEPPEWIDLWIPPRLSEILLSPRTRDATKARMDFSDFPPRIPQLFLNDAPIPPVPTIDPGSPIQKPSSDPVEHLRQVDRLLEWFLRGYFPPE